MKNRPAVPCRRLTCWVANKDAGCVCRCRPAVLWACLRRAALACSIAWRRANQCCLQSHVCLLTVVVPSPCTCSTVRCFVPFETRLQDGRYHQQPEQYGYGVVHLGLWPTLSTRGVRLAGLQRLRPMHTSGFLHLGPQVLCVRLHACTVFLVSSPS